MSKVALKFAAISLLVLILLSAVNQLVLAQSKCYKFGEEVPCEDLKGLLGLGLGFMAFFFIIGIASSVFWILMLIHAATKPIEDKAVWILVIVFTNVIGALIYYFVVKRKFKPEQPTPPPTVQ